MSKPLKFAAIGIDHRHIFGQSENMMNVGAEFVGWWTEGTPETLDSFIKRFPDVPQSATRQELLNNPEIDFVLIADVPSMRADRAIEAMQHGKDVMVDKPGCTTLAQLDAIKDTVAQTGRIWSIDFPSALKFPA